MSDKYYLGLDIGTESCGWAVTDENYNLLKAKGNKLWGVRLFESANTAEERRIKRSNRRRLARRKLKLAWLQDIFHDEVCKVDPSFWNRIKFSNLWEDDKKNQDISLNSKDSLFNGKVGNIENYTDENYFKDYPTIYHLRKELTQQPAKDIRLLYLAVHNIIKRRGHFLYEGDFAENGSIVELINNLITSLQEQYEDLSFNTINTGGIQESTVLNILQQNLGLRDTKNKLKELLNAIQPKEKLLVDCFVDGKFDIKKIFDLDSADKVNFADADYDVKLNEISTMLTDDQLSIIEQSKTIYSLIQLKKILEDNDYICEAMVDMYNTHHNQLKFLKEFIKQYHKNHYFKMFRDSQEKITKGEKLVTNYPLYVKGSIFDNKKRVVDINNTDRTQESFYKYVKEVITSPIHCENYNEVEYLESQQQILSWIENEEFLNKQRSKNNSVFSNKLYEKELKAILLQSAQKYSFLNNIDTEYNITNIDKILNILTFRVPYFVGPIGNNENGQNHGWSIKEKDITYRPWTLPQMIDFDKSEDNFIARMSNKCTYLKDKEVLPKNSILYSKFKVLNELNNLAINGNPITVELKQQIFNQLFEKEVKVTTKKLKDFLVRENYISITDIQNTSITGIDKEFANNYSVYVKLISNLGFEKSFVDNNIEVFEEIIKYHTVISDKNRLEKRIKAKFGNLFNDDQIKKLKGLNYQGWARLSKEFLTMPLVDKKDEFGLATSIIEIMWNTNQNLQEIIFNSRYDLEATLDKLNDQQKDDLFYEDVEKLYCSPSVKRGVWQAIKIIKEIKNTIGTMPEKIFVEVTRSDEKKGEDGRKLSRQTNLLNIYKSKEFKDSVSETAADISALIAELSDKDDTRLRSEKLYLYFLQMGKCMYSGEKINIEDVFNDKMYDIDHIVPQSKIKDDSIDNKVLVKSEYNRQKSDHYPIYSAFPQWVNNQSRFWESLKKANLISAKKYNNLIEKEELTDERLSGFIARQLVETNQSAKAVIDLLKTIVENPSNIVFSKAKFVSEFRNMHNIYKSRLVNDLHHAKDAYLNIVVGDILNNRFTNDPKNFYRTKNKNTETTKNISKILDKGSIVYSPVTGEVIWNTDKDIEKIKEICESNTCLISKMSHADLNGAFYDESVYKSKKNNPSTNASVQLKGSSSNPLADIEKYGGYNSLKNAYFMVVESSDKKGNRIKTIESVPILIYRKYKDCSDKDTKILDYIAQANNLITAKIILPKLNFHSTLKIDNGLYWLGGKTGNGYALHNANQWFANNHQTKYVKALEKYADLKANRKDGKLEEKDNIVILSPASKINNTEISLSKAENISLYNDLISQLSKKIYSGLQLDSGLKEKLIAHIEDFNGLSVLDQAKVLLGILQGISTGATPADLTRINESKFSGKLFISKDITSKNISLVELSPTGLYSKVTKL